MSCCGHRIIVYLQFQSQYISNVNFGIPSKPWRKMNNGETDEYVSTLVLVTRTNDISSLKLDGLTMSGWVAVDATYSVNRVQVSDS